MIEWLKSKAIIILVVFLVPSVIANGIFSWVLFKQGLKVIHNSYITTTSESNSYSSSGSFSMNVWGQYGNWIIKEKSFASNTDMRKFMKLLSPISYFAAKPDWVEHTLQWPDITQNVNEVKGKPDITKKIIEE